MLHRFVRFSHPWPPVVGLQMNMDAPSSPASAPSAGFDRWEMAKNLGASFPVRRRGPSVQGGARIMSRHQQVRLGLLHQRRASAPSPVEPVTSKPPWSAPGLLVDGTGLFFLVLSHDSIFLNPKHIPLADLMSVDQAIDIDRLLSAALNLTESCCFAAPCYKNYHKETENSSRNWRLSKKIVPKNIDKIMFNLSHICRNSENLVLFHLILLLIELIFSLDFISKNHGTKEFFLAWRHKNSPQRTPSFEVFFAVFFAPFCTPPALPAGAKRSSAPSGGRPEGAESGSVLPVFSRSLRLSRPPGGRFSPGPAAPPPRPPGGSSREDRAEPPLVHLGAEGGGQGVAEFFLRWAKAARTTRKRNASPQPGDTAGSRRTSHPDHGGGPWARGGSRRGAPRRSSRGRVW